MEFKPDNVSALRHYLFDYIVGVLWILAGSIALVPRARLESFLRELDCLAAQTPHLKVPNFVVGFGIIIGGVVLPYCASVVLRPATLRLMGLLQDKERAFRRSRAESRLDRRHEEPQVDVLARDRIRRDLAAAGIDVNREVRITFVHVRNPRVAAYITANEEETFFRATAVPPSAMLVAAVLYRFVFPGHTIALSLFAIALILFGSWLSNRTFSSWMIAVNTAVLLAPERPEPGAENGLTSESS